jgi:hypothetical protein
MAVTFGAVSFGVTAPSGYLQESSQDTTIELATIRNENGHTVIAQAKPRLQTVTNVKSKSDATMIPVITSGEFSGATCTSAKISQTNDDFSTSEATYTLHE